MDLTTLLGISRDGMGHILNMFFSFSVSQYLTNWWLFAFVGYLPAKGLPPVVNIQGGSFELCCAVHSVSRDDHVTHAKGVAPPQWQLILCERTGNLQEDVSEM